MKKLDQSKETMESNDFSGDFLGTTEGNIADCDNLTYLHYCLDQQRPGDGRICSCEDAPCCGHYDL